jgi:hypothetical protein
MIIGLFSISEKLGINWVDSLESLMNSYVYVKQGYTFTILSEKMCNFAGRNQLNRFI